MGTAALALLVSIAPVAINAAPPRNAYEQDLVLAVQGHVDAYRAWDLEAFVDTFAEDATVMIEGKGATGHEAIRRLYADHFAGAPHTITVLESGVRRGLVYLTLSYTFEDGRERCCAYAEYYAKDGKIVYLSSKMSNRARQVRRTDAP
jgi:hypothetical protein